MAQLLGISVVVVPLLFAMWGARQAKPRRGLRRTVLLSLLFSAAYVVALHFLYIRLALR
jgi:hypothetical protein